MKCVVVENDGESCYWIELYTFGHSRHNNDGKHGTHCTATETIGMPVSGTLGVGLRLVLQLSQNFNKLKV